MLHQAEEEHILDDAVDLQDVNACGESVRNIQREDVVLTVGDDVGDDTRMLDEGNDAQLAVLC